ncbi:Gfo/Idh/MocA family oxidoreductase, partial [Rhodococcus erythropolis]
MGARIGVIGLGRIGSYHARNLLTTDGVDALVVTDVDARRTSDVASELDVESAADPDALLASG